MHILYSKGKESEPKSKNPKSRLFVMTDAAVESKMQRIVEASNGSSDLVRLVEISRSRGMMGIHGTWEQFLEVYDPTYGKVFTSTSWRPRLDLVTFLYSLTEMEDLRILALCLRPTRCLVYDFSRDVNNESVEQFLVRKTLSHADHHFDHLFPFNSGKRVLTESKWFFADAKLRVPLTRRMIAVRCAVVICEDESVAAARVVAVDDNFNVLLDTFVKPDKPVVHYRTAITGITAQDVENVEALSLADVQVTDLVLVCSFLFLRTHCIFDLMDHFSQAQLVKLFTHDVIMVGYQLHLDLHGKHIVPYLFFISFETLFT